MAGVVVGNSNQVRVVAFSLPQLTQASFIQNKPESFQPSKASQTFQYFEK